MEVKGDSWAYGWNAGALWQLTPQTRLGLSYRTKVKHKLEGKSKSAVFDGTTPVAPGVFPNWNSKGSVDLNLPAIAELSVNHQLTDTVSMQASWMRIYWSSFEEIKVELDNNGNGSPIPTIESNWNDVNRFAVGATWNYTDQLTFRAGIAKDESPVDDKYRTFRIPDTERMWYTVGGSYKLDKNQDVDFGYGYIKGGNEKIYENKPAVQGKITNSTAHMFSLQYNYRF